MAAVFFPCRLFKPFSEEPERKYRMEYSIIKMSITEWFFKVTCTIVVKKSWVIGFIDKDQNETPCLLFLVMVVFRENGAPKKLNKRRLFSNKNHNKKRNISLI